MSNTGQLPPEVVEAVRQDNGGEPRLEATGKEGVAASCSSSLRGGGGSGSVGGGGNGGSGCGHEDPAFGHHLALDLDTLNSLRGGTGEVLSKEAVSSLSGREEKEGEEGSYYSPRMPLSSFSSMVGGGDQIGWVSPPSTASPRSVGMTDIRGNSAAEHSRLALQLWWPLLAGLAGGAGDPRLDCRAAALSTLRDLLKASDAFSFQYPPC